MVDYTPSSNNRLQYNASASVILTWWSPSKSYVTCALHFHHCFKFTFVLTNINNKVKQIISTPDIILRFGKVVLQLAHF